MSFLTGTLEQGLIYGIMALGVYLSFRVLDYADLSVDGSLPLGAAICAILIYNGSNPWLATLLAIIGGAIAGVFTGFLHTRLKITPLLSGILTMTALYSVNLRVMGGNNVPLLRAETVFTVLQDIGLPEKIVSLGVPLVVVTVLVIILNYFLQTELGMAVRATGDNEQMIKAQGVDTNYTKLLGLSVSNALVAFSGALVAQYQTFADVSMGIGTIIAGLASVIIGEVLIGTGSILRRLLAVVAGSVMYRLVIALVLTMGLKPTDLKLMTALIVIIALASPSIKKKLRVGLKEGKYAQS
jgi:putative ABC transport system permease protein